VDQKYCTHACSGLLMLRLLLLLLSILLFCQVKDALETDVNCGGGICQMCGTTKNCLVNSDCLSNNCSATTLKCLQAVTCTNGIKDGRETGVDCGGGGCNAACNVGVACNTKWDCKTQQCVNGVCAAAPPPPPRRPPPPPPSPRPPPPPPQIP
jgi:hypothetical protein